MPSKPFQRALVWLRRDLRADDHAALAAACTQADQVWCVFVFDTAILDPLPRRDRRVAFIHHSLTQLDAELGALGQRHGHAPGAVRLIVRHGVATEILPALARQLRADLVCLNHDDEPDALRRDTQVREHLHAAGIVCQSFKDHVLFERGDVLTGANRPYSVFTPYKNAWLKRLRAHPEAMAPHAVAPHAQALAPWPEGLGTPGIPPLTALGFEPIDDTTLRLPCGSAGARALLADFLPRIGCYADKRDFPASKGPSYLSVHLRFGTVSIRELVREAWALGAADNAPGPATWLSELIWRDFYHQILHHHPHVVGQAFKLEFDSVCWEEGPEADALFDAWCHGRTGYPLVDAGMRQLWQTGYMHNRLRMVVASFLTKDLGVDWRRGEAWFALHLNDFDLAANNGGWQWAASTGCDAQPWFRIFNPVTQSEKFDPQGKFIRRYVPELAGLDDRSLHAPWLVPALSLAAAGVRLGMDYPRPVVDHDAARQRTLARFGTLKPGR